MGATMTTFHAIHRWNALLCPPIGLLANLLLILLVLTKTPKEMRLHSRILLQTGILDLLLLLVTTIGQPILTYQQTTLLFLFEGYFIEYFTNDSPTGLLIFYNIWIICNMFGFFALCVQFLYRYLVLNRSIKINFCQYLQMLFAVLFAIIIFRCSQYFQNIINEQNSEILDDELVQSFKNGSTRFLVRSIQERWTKIYNSVFMIAILIYCGTIAFFARKMSHFVNSQLIGRKKELGKQLSMTLIILAILPLIQMAIVTIVIIVNIIAESMGNATNSNKERMALAQMYSLLMTHWLPVLNPLVTILSNQPYRKAMLIRGIHNRIFVMPVQTTH